MANIIMKNILLENMRRFRTKNLNEQINASDESPITLLGTKVVLIDGIGDLSAYEALQFAKSENSRLLTKQEIEDYLKQARGYEKDDRFPENVQYWRAFIQDPNNPENPMLWDLRKNAEAPRALPATRFLGVRLNPNFDSFDSFE